MNSDQLRMARALLRLTIIDLAEISGVDKMAIVRFEAGRNPHAATVEKLRKTFNERGVIFIGAVDTCWEATVAMKHGMKPHRRNAGRAKSKSTSRRGAATVTYLGFCGDATLGLAAKLLFLLAIPGGLEPPTLGLEGRCSILLSYGTLKMPDIASVYVN